MITNKQQLDAALNWIDYWKTNMASNQSWIGHEQASRHVLRLRKDIEEYRRNSAEFQSRKQDKVDDEPSSPELA
ncbi:MAG: hypothetical protein NVSMB52_12150 [Chloroflexota bacterium]